MSRSRSSAANQKELIASRAPNARDFTNRRTRYAGIVDEAVCAKNRNKSKIRSRAEHVFGVVKRMWKFGKVRYRGLQKNATRAFTVLALANIYVDRQRLMAQVVHEPRKRAYVPAKPGCLGNSADRCSPNGEKIVEVGSPSLDCRYLFTTSLMSNCMQRICSHRSDAN